MDYQPAKNSLIPGTELDQYIKNLVKTCFEQLNNISFDYIYKSITFGMDSQKNLMIYLPHNLFEKWFNLHIRQDLENCIYYHFTQINSVYYQVEKSNNKILQDFEYDPRFEFQNFLYNNNNFLSYMSIYEFAGSDNISLQTAIITGKKGTGKTHLMKAVANFQLSKYPNKKILYLPLDNLYSLYNHKYKEDIKIKSWLNLFDSILLDDLQQIDFFPNMQKELIALFDDFREQKKQIIFACRGNIKEIEFLDKQLSSRLESGLIVNLKQPDLDIKLRYLQKQNIQKDLNLDQNQILYLAGGIDNFKSMFAALVKLLAHKTLESFEINIEILQETIQQNSGYSPNKFEHLVSVLTDYFSFSFQDIKSSKRQKDLSLARQTGMYLCREILGYSYCQIGSLFGGRDHSTAMYSVKKIKQLQEINSDLNIMLKELKIKCQQNKD